MHFVEQKYKLYEAKRNENGKSHTQFWRDKACALAGALERNKRAFLYGLFCPKEKFLTFVFYLNV